MKYYVGVTDQQWYYFLRDRQNEDINFWQPGGQAVFKAIPPGSPFLFKLKYPLNAIGGVGFFSSHSLLPLNVAWDIFGVRNGVDSYFRFRQKIISYRNSRNTFDQNPNIGCIVLTDPIFFEEKDWIEPPKSWRKSIVQGKSYDINNAEDLRFWEKVEDTIARYHLFERADSLKSQLLLQEAEAQYSQKYLTKVRLGQGAFRVQLTDAYSRKCTISGEKTLPALEAAHIKPYSESGPHHISNGLLLRADIHKLFDTGYITITDQYRVEVSGRIKEEFSNGRDYYQYHGKQLLFLPENSMNHPNQQYIDWHNQHIYNG